MIVDTTEIVNKLSEYKEESKETNETDRMEEPMFTVPQEMKSPISKPKKKAHSKKEAKTAANEEVKVTVEQPLINSDKKVKQDKVSKINNMLFSSFKLTYSLTTLRLHFFLLFSLFIIRFINILAKSKHNKLFQTKDNAEPVVKHQSN